MFSRTLLAPLLCLMALLPGTAPAQLAISNGEGQSVQFGIQGQIWADFQQDSSGYQQNLYLRRIRFIAGGQLADDLTFFFQTDQPNLGKSPKAMGSGFLVQDAFLEYRIANAFRLDGGIMFVPLSRNLLQSTASYYTLDISPISTISNAATQSSGLRDVGLQARGFFYRDHLLYRVGVFSGERAANARNALRTAGYLQYDFFEREKGYVFTGTALGKQKILAVSAGFDRQGSYGAESAGVAASIPVRRGDEIGGQVQYLHYNGRERFASIPNQHDGLVEIAYYVRRAKAQPFGKYETQRIVGGAARDYEKWGGGAHYYAHGQNLKFTAQAQRVWTRDRSRATCNEFTVEMQVFYF